MATIDIGKIKPVFKGTYDNSTAYTLDDIVYYNGSSYVAKTSTTGNLPTDTTKWNILASGSGGIWDSTLSLGSAGQSVKVNSGGTALEFGTISSDYVKLASGSVSNQASVSIDGYFSSTYKIYKLYLVNYRPVTSGDHFAMRVNIGGSAQSSGNYRFNGVNLYRDSNNHSVGSLGSNWNHDKYQTNVDDFNTSRGSGMDFTFYDPSSTTNDGIVVDTSLNWRRNDNATWQRGVGGFTFDNGSSAISGVTIFEVSGNNINIGNWALYGIK